MLDRCRFRSEVPVDRETEQDILFLRPAPNVMNHQRGSGGRLLVGGDAYVRKPIGELPCYNVTRQVIGVLVDDGRLANGALQSLFALFGVLFLESESS
jgi:hypothetical protein